MLFRIAVVLIALAAPAVAAVDWSHARPVTVVASEYQFSPNKLTFERGVAYRLHLENHGKETARVPRARVLQCRPNCATPRC